MCTKRKIFFELTVLIALLWVNNYCYGGPLDQLTSFGDTVATTFKGIGEGMATSFSGSVPSGYIYTFRMFNGTRIPITVGLKGKITIMAGTFNQTMDRLLTLQPGTDSGSFYTRCNLLFQLQILPIGFKEDHIVLGEKNDPNIYVYHVYETMISGVLGYNAEVIGSMSLTEKQNPGSHGFTEGLTMVPDFSASIYNGSGVGAQLTFTFGSVKIPLLLEPDTYNLLVSTPENSIRPSQLVGPKNSVIIPVEGLGNASSSTPEPTPGTSSKKPEKETISTSPLTYNYEFFSDGTLGETGFGPNHYKQATNGKIRNITPMKFGIFHQPSGIDATDSAEAVLDLNIPLGRMWVYYSGELFSQASKRVIRGLLAPIDYGKCIQF